MPTLALQTHRKSKQYQNNAYQPERHSGKDKASQVLKT